MPFITPRIATNRSPKEIRRRKRADREAEGTRNSPRFQQQPRPYYTLLERDSAKEPWTIQFGDYDKANVQFELEDRRNHGVLAKNLKIISTGNLAKDVTEAVEKLNGAK